MNTKIKKALGVTLRIIEVLVLISVIGIFILSKISGSPVFIFGKTTMWVVTDSMSPAIPAKSYILVEKVEFDDIRVGDVIAFKSTDPRISGQINTHRVISIDGNNIVTKGDNNTADDGAYSAKPENIVGRYVKNLTVMTFLGRIVMSNAGFIIVMLILITSVLLYSVPQIRDALKNKETATETQADGLDESARKEIDRLVEEEMQRRKSERSENGETDENGNKTEDKGQ